MLKNVFILIALSANLSWAGVPIEAPAEVDHIYVPKGFDSNDRSEVVISGTLPNFCHQAPLEKIEMKNGKINITLSTLYYDSTNPFCRPFPVPFVHVVKLGTLKAGDYQVDVNSKTKTKLNGVLNIVEPDPDKVGKIDNQIYAPVGHIAVEEGSDVVELQGYNPSSCLILDKIDYIHNKNDTYSVLPIMKVDGDVEDCPRKMVPFNYKWVVPKDLQKKKVLLHVRSMDGNSVNQIFEHF